jgi:hypothetical protein
MVRVALFASFRAPAAKAGTASTSMQATAAPIVDFIIFQLLSGGSPV